MQLRLLARGWRKPVLTLIALLACSSFLTAQAYQQINLDSDFNPALRRIPDLRPIRAFICSIRGDSFPAVPVPGGSPTITAEFLRFTTATPELCFL